MLSRAFVGYSHVDSDYVREFAKRLTRWRVRFDEYTFRSGRELSDDERAAIAGSELFVLVASPASLGSDAVQMEIAYAEAEKSRRAGFSSMAIIADERTTVRDLPSWMLKALVKTEPVPQLAARYVATRLSEIDARSEGRRFFVGRETDIAEFGKRSTDEEPSRLFILNGLPGVGRCTFLSKAADFYLDLDLAPVFRLEATDQLDRIYALLLDETSTVSERKQLGERLSKFLTLSRADQVAEVVKLLVPLSRKNLMPVFVDGGALLTDSAEYVPPVSDLIALVLLDKLLHLAFVHARYPRIDRAWPAVHIQTIRQLGDDEMKLLIQKTFESASVSISAEDIGTLAEGSGGYPPAADFALAVARRYGVADLGHHAALLREFQEARFGALLDHLKLSDLERSVLAILANERELPTVVLAEVLVAPIDDVLAAVRSLTDLNVLIPTAAGFEVARPLSETAFRRLGILSVDQFAKIAASLRAHYWTTENAPPLSVLDATLHALSRAKSPDLKEFEEFILPSTLLKWATESYRDRDWETTILYCRRVLVLDPERHHARELLCKALIRVGDRWDEARAVLDEIDRRQRRVSYYLHGFFYWKRGQFEDAISWYQRALASGNTSVAVYTDLAQCLFHGARHKEALEQIAKAVERYGSANRFLIDLSAKIAIAAGDVALSETYLARLREVDEQDYFHRLSSLRATQRRTAEAVAAAEQANSFGTPRFEIQADLPDRLIEAGNYGEAARLIEELEPISATHKDVQWGLRLKLALREGNWIRADSCWSRLRHKELPIHRRLRREVLVMALADEKLTSQQKASFELEFERLGGILPDADVALLVESDSEPEPPND
jgi:tetratricopeptide (TPR) repeat protein